MKYESSVKRTDSGNDAHEKFTKNDGSREKIVARRFILHSRVHLRLCRQKEPLRMPARNDRGRSYLPCSRRHCRNLLPHILRLRSAHKRLSRRQITPESHDMHRTYGRGNYEYPHGTEFRRHTLLRVLGGVRIRLFNAVVADCPRGLTLDYA